MSALNAKCWTYASFFFFFCQGLWKNSKAELWWRQHSLGGEKTVQIWDEVRWCCQVSPNFRSTRHCYLSGLRLLCTKQHGVVILPSPQVDQCLGRACAFDLMAEYGGRFVGAGRLISTLGSSHSFAGIFSLDESFAVTSFFFVAGFCVLMRIGHSPFTSLFRHLISSVRSEIRLMEIVEGLCESSSFECNRMVEEHEDHFETWWFKRWAVVDSVQRTALASRCNFPTVWS